MFSITEEQIDQPKTLTKNSFYLGFLFFAGILLPSISFTIELSAHTAATMLFDPMPTWWHVFFVLFVPVTNFQIWWAIRKGGSQRLGWLGLANAIAVCISLFYSLVFAPFTPLAVIGIIFFFIGLLPLAPLFSLIAGILMRRQLFRIKPDDSPFTLRWPGLIVGAIVVFSAIGAAELSLTLTKIGIEQANAATVEEQNKGLEFLRKYGDRDYILRLSYDNSGLAMSDVFLNFWTVGNDFFRMDDGGPRTTNQTVKARSAYYRLTGKEYRQAPTPRGIKNWDSFNNISFVEDGTSLRVNRGLSLIGSQIDGSVDGDAALGYLEWTLTFRNDTTGQQEAVSQIQLPPGGVVSRLTLWINGEEREAAFAKGSRVIEAYNAVTRVERRDPALVTTAGKDRISLKCSPVPANGEMKVRIGITTPLMLENATSSLLPMPYFQDRNFEVLTEHGIWIESKKPLEIASNQFIREARENLFAVRGSVRNNEMTKIGSPIRALKSADVRITWATDRNDPNTVIKQEIKETVRPKPGRLVFIVDASLAMKDFQNEVRDAIGNLSKDTETALILTSGNGLNLEYSAPNSFTGNPEQTAEILKNAAFDGGTDSVPAISAAWELAQDKENSAIIWIHAPQPVEMALPKNLAQLWTRRPNGAPVYSVQTTNGKDVVDKVLNESSLVDTVPRFGSLKDDLSRLFAELDQQKAGFKAVRTAESRSSFHPAFHPAADSKETSQHLVRLWANDEVNRLLIGKEDEKAIDLAVKNQLVTAVSGAVVLETKEQYDRFGLKPVDPNTVPTVPEPVEYLLFGIVLAVLGWFMYRFRRQGLRSSVNC